MTPTQAAKIIGCTPAHVRAMIRSKRLPANKTPIGSWGESFYYDVSEQEAKRIRDSVTGKRSTRGKKLKQKRGK